MNDYSLKIFAGSAHPALATEITSILGVELGKSTTTHFPDTEIHVQIDEVVRAQDVFLIQPCSPPVNDNLMELILYLDAFRRASVHRVNVVIPYFPYARQDRMVKGRESISARVVANLLEEQGARRVIFVDIHNLAIQGFFNIPVDPLAALPVFVEYLKRPEYENSAIVSPDVGRAGLAGKFAEALNLPLVVMHKRRSGLETHTTHVMGDIAGRRPIIIDDLIASGSVLKQLDALYEKGAIGKAVFAITHPLLLPQALINLDDERIEELVVTNTLPIPPEKHHKRLKILSIAPLLADVINRIHTGKSITELLVKA